jgi:hypothetical protein
MPFAKAKNGVFGVADDIGTSPDAIQITSFTSQDLAALSPGQCSIPRGFIVSNVGAGTKVLEVVTAAGQTRTYDVSALQAAYIPLAIRSITSNTTVTSVTVFY